MYKRQLLGPADLGPLLQVLADMRPERYVQTTIQAMAPLSLRWRDAPYPDKGYRAGPRALPRLL